MKKMSDGKIISCSEQLPDHSTPGSINYEYYYKAKSMLSVNVSFHLSIRLYNQHIC